MIALLQDLSKLPALRGTRLGGAKKIELVDCGGMFVLTRFADNQLETVAADPDSGCLRDVLKRLPEEETALYALEWMPRMTSREDDDRTAPINGNDNHRRFLGASTQRKVGWHSNGNGRHL